MHLQESQFKEKNHMVTEKSNSTQLQVIFESLDQQSFPSNLYCGVLQINGFVIYGGLTRKNQRGSESGGLLLKFLLPFFRFGLFQKIIVPST